MQEKNNEKGAVEQAMKKVKNGSKNIGLKTHAKLPLSLL